MRQFRYVEDIIDWLDPMDYPGFWAAIAPYDLELQPRDHCDAEIASGAADEATVLDCLKYMARMELRERLGLDWRPVAPWLEVVQ